MPKRYPVEQRERATRMAPDRLGEYRSPYAAAQALGPKLGVGPETLRKWIVWVQLDGGARSGPTSELLGEIRRLRAENLELKEANEILQAASIFLREGARPSPAMICGFIDAMRAEGHRACADLHCPAFAGSAGRPRSYRSASRRPPAARTVADAQVIDALRALQGAGPGGGPAPETLYGRRKMTAWLERNDFRGVSKHAVHRLMRQEGQRGLVRGRKVRTTIPGTGARRAGDLLNRQFRTDAPSRA